MRGLGLNSYSFIPQILSFLATDFLNPDYCLIVKFVLYYVCLRLLMKKWKYGCIFFKLFNLAEAIVDLSLDF